MSVTKDWPLFLWYRVTNFMLFWAQQTHAETHTSLLEDAWLYVLQIWLKLSNIFDILWLVESIVWTLKKSKYVHIIHYVNFGWNPSILTQNLQTGSAFWQLALTHYSSAIVCRSCVVYSILEVFYSQQTQGVGSRHRFAVPHQEAAVFPCTGQQVFSSNTGDVPMVPRCCCHGAFKRAS